MKKEYQEALWNAYIETAEVPEHQKKYLKTIGNSLMQEVPFLYRIYGLIGEQEEISECSEIGIHFEKEGESYILRQDSSGILLKEEAMKKLIVDMIGLFEEILPLGSVVDLKKEVLAEQLDLSGVDNFRVVITKRFMGTGESCYYPYGAVIYPVGTAGQGNVFSFTPALIGKTLFRGYGDWMEDEFVYQMKLELIVRKGRKSMGFASPDERNAFFEQVQNRKEAANG